MQGRRKILSQRQLSFVAAHDGNDTEAAKAAGYKNPGRSAAKLMAIPAVRKAIEEKQKAIIEASGAKIGQRLSKVAVVDRLVELADLPPERTKGNITGQVNALKAIAEIEQFLVRQTRDVTKEADGKTEAEMEFFCVHGYWPEREQSGSRGSESSSKDPSKPN
jgi:hypothetical protein